MEHSHPEIVRQLSSLDSPVVDRTACEKIFGLKRRRAIDVMQHFGGYRSGNTILLDRIALIAKLQQFSHSPDLIIEFRRKKRIAQELEDANRYRRAKHIPLQVPNAIQTFQLADLHPDISLKPGTLIVHFNSSEELFTRLYELSQVAANDFDQSVTLLRSFVGQWNYSLEKLAVLAMLKPLRQRCLSTNGRDGDSLHGRRLPLNRCDGPSGQSRLIACRMRTVACAH